jgi:hypothetical protein
MRSRVSAAELFRGIRVSVYEGRCWTFLPLAYMKRAFLVSPVLKTERE